MTSNCTTTAYSLGGDEGTAYWFAGALMVAKDTAGRTGGSFDLLDPLAPPNYAPPGHVHHDEDEAWYLLEGM